MAKFAALAAGAMALAIASSLPLAGAIAQDTAAFPPVDIGFIEIADNPAHDPIRSYYMVQSRQFDSPLPGAELGLADAQVIGNAIKVKFGLKSAGVISTDEIISTVKGWVAEGTHFVIADLPAADLLTLADAVADQPVTILNVGAKDDTLRGDSCRFNLVHMIPSYRMYTDAMVQFLVFKKWRNILVLQGPTPEDQATVDALKQSVQFFGANIVEVRPVLLSNDPLNREQSNVALVTGGSNYDVIYIADNEGEFARFTPYETSDPRPVVGSAGLTASAWTWAYQNHGSSEVTQRFEENVPRHMGERDWAAWISVKAVVQSVLRTKNGDYQALVDYLLGERLNLDGGKGNPLSVRPWDHQLRQAMPLATLNAVLEEAPITGFLHQTNDLDSLGVDAPQSTCKFPG